MDSVVERGGARGGFHVRATSFSRAVYRRAAHDLDRLPFFISRLCARLACALRLRLAPKMPLGWPLRVGTLGHAREARTLYED